MGSYRALALLLFVALVVGIQFIPVPRSNPPVTADFETPADVKTILQRACYDCHSNETDWPWYSRVAPISWLVARHVREGREEFNLSDWGRLSTREQLEVVEEMWEEVEEGEMPPPVYYLPAHPEARLSAQDRAVVRAWVAAERSQEDG